MTASEADAGFRDWYRERYGVPFGGEGNMRLVPMDLREAWSAAWAQAGEAQARRKAADDLTALTEELGLYE